jgi:hypothetical protein
MTTNQPRITFLIDDYRYEAAGLRRILSPAAAAQRTGRNSAALERGIERRGQALARLAREFEALGVPREVTGALADEDHLLTRGVKGRPELRARLRSARATVAAYVESLEG